MEKRKKKISSSFKKETTKNKGKEIKEKIFSGPKSGQQKRKR